MTPSEAGKLLAVFRADYSHVVVDEDMTALWINAMANTDFDDAMEAASEWILTQKYWPTVSEFNAVVTSMRQAAAREGNVPMIPRSSGRRFGCDGTGWLDRGQGLEPCPSCNPWGEMLWENGDWQNLRVQPPREWVQPMSCRPIHTDSDVFEFDKAKAAIERGYREHWDEVDPVDEGWSIEEIEDREERITEKLVKLFRSGPTVGER